MAKSEDPDELLCKAAFHQSLHVCRDKCKQPSGTEIPFYRNFNPLRYRMKTPYLLYQYV